MRHAVLQHQVGEIREAQQEGLGAPQFEDADDQRPVVALAFSGAHGIGFVQLRRMAALSR